MTDKRFNFEDEYITFDGGVFATTKNSQDAELISRTLNQLYDESEELKHQVNYLEDRLDDLIVLKKENTDLKKENEQLKKFKEDVFNLIDKNIKETKEIFEDGKIDLISYNDAMIILIGLKEELKGDLE